MKRIKECVCLAALAALAALAGCGGDSPPDEEPGASEQGAQSLWAGGAARVTPCEVDDPEAVRANVQLFPRPGELLLFKLGSARPGQGCWRIKTTGAAAIYWTNLDVLYWPDGSSLNDNVGSWVSLPMLNGDVQRVGLCQHNDCVECWGGVCDPDYNIRKRKSTWDYMGEPGGWNGPGYLSAIVLENDF